MEETKLSFNDCRPAVQRFALLMQDTLRKHDDQYPDGWSKDNFSHLYKRLLEEAGEIIDADSDRARVLECVNVANQALILTDKCLWGHGR